MVAQASSLRPTDLRAEVGAAMCGGHKAAPSWVHWTRSCSRLRLYRLTGPDHLAVLPPLQQFGPLLHTQTCDSLQGREAEEVSEAFLSVCVCVCVRAVSLPQASLVRQEEVRPCCLHDLLQAHSFLLRYKGLLCEMSVTLSALVKFQNGLDDKPCSQPHKHRFVCARPCSGHCGQGHRGD